MARTKDALAKKKDGLAKKRCSQKTEDAFAIKNIRPKKKMHV